MPEFPGRLRTPRLASAPATPAVGEMYYDTGSNRLLWWSGSAWIPAMDAGSFARVSSLPGSPVDGQECYYVADATNGVIWHLKYNSGSASAYKWEFVGGDDLYAEVLTAFTTSSGTYVDDGTTPGPQITIPLAGDYKIRGEAVIAWATGETNAIAAIKIGVAATADSDGVASISGNIGASAGAGGSVGRTLRRTGLAASTVLKMQFRIVINSAAFAHRKLLIHPTRVG